MIKKIILIIFILLFSLLFVRSAKAKAEAPGYDDPNMLETAVEPVTIQEFAYNQVKLEWDESQWESFNNIIYEESKWDCNAQNPYSTAYGCGQFLDSTWEDTGYEKTSDPEIQILATIRYISNRYKTPERAWRFWQEKRWY